MLSIVVVTVGDVNGVVEVIVMLLYGPMVDVFAYGVVRMAADIGSMSKTASARVDSTASMVAVLESKDLLPELRMLLIQDQGTSVEVRKVAEGTVRSSRQRQLSGGHSCVLGIYSQARLQAMLSRSSSFKAQQSQRGGNDCNRGTKAGFVVTVLARVSLGRKGRCQ